MTFKKLLLFTIAVVMMLFSQANAASVDTVKAAIVKYSVEMGVDPAIINEVQLELKDKGFDVSLIHDENGVITMHISWGRLPNN